MSENELLQILYKNADMGLESISSLLGRAGDVRMRGEMIQQLNDYKNRSRAVKAELSARNIEAEPEKMMTRTMAKFGISINSAFDKTTSHIAEMIINGSTMSIIDLTRSLNQMPNGFKGVACDMCRDMIGDEQATIEKMKTYL